MSLTKKMRSCRYLFTDFLKDRKEFSFQIALYFLCMKFRGCSSFITEEHRMKILKKYVDNEFGPTIHKLAADYIQDNEKEGDRCIWVIWWQGADQMPELVKACYNHLLQIAGDFEVRLITETNYREYLELPEFILSKVEEKAITLTHLSDIIRVKLLLDYGGLYLDATIFANNVQFVEKYDFFTLRTPGELKGFISDGDWAGFSMYCKYRNSLLMKCLYECFCFYWQKHSRMVDYLLIDYVFRSIYDNVVPVRNMIEEVPVSRGYYLLDQNINEAYSSDNFKSFMKDTNWQKMSYKRTFKEYTEGCLLTNFGYLKKLS